ncbi:MAG: organic solvent tolerance protein OstA [Bacteroidetes bacterium]|nr:organic solvent tolerance protein OstA [Bacteroidota bacterium]
MPGHSAEKIFPSGRFVLLITVLVIFAFSNHPGFSQKKTQVKIVNARELRIDNKVGENIKQLVGDVVMRQDSTWFYCDSALLNSQSNNFDAFGNVRINVNDTLNIYGDVLNYDGATRLAIMHYNVKMVDKRAVLTTDHLNYDRNTGIAFYNTGGRIVSDTNILTSRIGYFYSNENLFFFRDSVVLTNPDYIMRSDTLKYHTVTETAFFLGPTTITGEENFIYCERGWYDTKNNISSLKQNAYIVHGDQTVEGDSIYYNRGRSYGEAYRNIIITDTVEDIIINGNYAEFDRDEGYAFVTDSALAIMIDKYDSLFLHADTIMVMSDSSGKAEVINAYHKVKFFRPDLQGMSDSMTYFVPDSTVTLRGNPILWSDENQLSADTIKIVYANNEVDSMVMYNSCFIISRDDSTTFNQIKGKTMVGYFKENRIYKITVSGNSETIYFVREEDRTLIGINKALASRMLIFLDGNEISTISYIDKPDAHLVPEKDYPPAELKLKGFQWIEEQRPLDRYDIFKWD